MCSCFLVEVWFLPFQALIRKNTPLNFVQLAFTQDTAGTELKRTPFPASGGAPAEEARLPPCGTMGATSQSWARRAGGRTARPDCERSGCQHMGPSGRRGRPVGSLATGGTSSGKRGGAGLLACASHFEHAWAVSSCCKRRASGCHKQPKRVLQNTLATRGVGRLPLT